MSRFLCFFSNFPFETVAASCITFYLYAQVLWFPPDLSLDDLLKRDLSLPIWEKIDVSIYRGSVQLRERAAHMRILSEVRWESKVARDMRSFDGPKEPEISQFPKHVIHIISACDI